MDERVTIRDRPRGNHPGRIDRAKRLDRDAFDPKAAPPGIANMEQATVVPSQPEAWRTMLEGTIRNTYHAPASKV
ncbi:MAG: hypothetical protein ACOYXR_09795 [Nitrospirota bacterium]